jgi:hypothetical protein
LKFKPNSTFCKWQAFNWSKHNKNMMTFPQKSNRALKPDDCSYKQFFLWGMLFSSKANCELGLAQQVTFFESVELMFKNVYKNASVCSTNSKIWIFVFLFVFHWTINSWNYHMWMWWVFEFSIIFQQVLEKFITKSVIHWRNIYLICGHLALFQFVVIPSRCLKIKLQNIRRFFC